MLDAIATSRMQTAGKIEKGALGRAGGVRPPWRPDVEGDKP